jgi:hypothetical protein
MLDGLWPFIVAYSKGDFSRTASGAPVYVLDIGLYILPLLRTVFPAISFVPFVSINALPVVYEVVKLRGPGMARFGSSENPFMTAFGTDVQKIRDVVYGNLNITAKAKCIVQLSRQMEARNLDYFHSKSAIDRSKESPFLRTFHNAGEHLYTAMYYGDSTGHERRAMQNEQSLFKQMSKVFNKKFGICVKLVQLDKLSIREQFETFATAKLVIAQHGAGLTYAPFLPTSGSDQGIVLELNPQINPNFKLACEAMGVKHSFLDRVEHSEIYLSTDDTFIEVSEKQVIKAIMSHLVGWAAPEEGQVLDLSMAPLSKEALKERAAIEVSLSAGDGPRTREIDQCVSSLDGPQLCPDAPATTPIDGSTRNKHSRSVASSLPEVPYIKEMIRRGLPFVWIDSGFQGVAVGKRDIDSEEEEEDEDEDDAKLPWAGVGRDQWEASMQRYVLVVVVSC